MEQSCCSHPEADYFLKCFIAVFLLIPMYFNVCVCLCVLVLDRLQCFLPQMALANETLKQQMENLPTGHFDIESVEEAEKVIEMVRPGRMVSSLQI